MQTITKTKVWRKSFDNNYIYPDKEWWVSWESFHSPLFRDSSGFQGLVSHKPASKLITAASAITRNHQECPPIFKTNLGQSHGLVGLTVGALIQFKWVPTDDIRARNHNPWMGQLEVQTWEKQTKKINIENSQKHSPASRHSCTNSFADSSCKHMVRLLTVECSGGVGVLWYQLIRTSFSVRWKPCRLIWRELKSPRRRRRSNVSRFETLCRKGNRFNCCHPSLPSLSSGYQPVKVFVVIFWPRWIYFRVPLLSYSSNFTLENSKCLWDVFLWTWCN